MKVLINNKEVETEAVTLLQLTNELSLPAKALPLLSITAWFHVRNGRIMLCPKEYLSL